MGCMTGLVLSGVTDEELAKTWSPQPTFTTPDFTALLSAFVEGNIRDFATGV